jgi:hypothetical protein
VADDGLRDRARPAASPHNTPANPSRPGADRATLPENPHPPVLAEKLGWWWREGFEPTNCRKPEPGDFVIPRRENGRVDKLVNHTKKTGAHLWARACREAGVESLTLHSTRHTFITLARRGRARAEVVERITHNAAGTIVDHYTHRDWQPLRQAVLAVRLPAPVAENVAAVPRKRRNPQLSPGGRGVKAPGIEQRRERAILRNLRTNTAN